MVDSKLHHGEGNDPGHRGRIAAVSSKLDFETRSGRGPSRFAPVTSGTIYWKTPDGLVWAGSISRSRPAEQARYFRQFLTVTFDVSDPATTKRPAGPYSEVMGEVALGRMTVARARAERRVIL